MNKVYNISGAKVYEITLMLLVLPNILFAAGWLSGMWRLFYVGVLVVGTVNAIGIINKIKENFFIKRGGITTISRGSYSCVDKRHRGIFSPVL